MIVEETETTKKAIMARLKSYTYYKHYCCACAAYLGSFTTKARIIVHFECRNKPVRYYNTFSESYPDWDGKHYPVQGDDC